MTPGTWPTPGTRSTRVAIGLVAWIALAAWLIAAGRPSRHTAAGGARPAIDAAWWLRPRPLSTVPDATGLVRPHDPVFAAGPPPGPAEDPAAGLPPLDRDWVQVGHVRSVEPRGETAIATIVWYRPADERERYPDTQRLELYQQHASLQEAVETLLPPAKRQRIRRMLTELLREHGQELTSTLRPLLEDSLRESLPLVEQAWRESVHRHQDEWELLGRRLHREVVAEQLVPLARREILPIVRRHGQEPLESIGRDLWDRASLWRFGWRAAYDRSPLPRRDLVRDEWERFVDQEAIPVFEAHLDALVLALERSLADIAANPAVRGELAEQWRRLAADPDANALAKTMLREAVVENRPLRQRLREIWTGDEAQDAIARSAERLEPTIRDIADELFGSQGQGIDPQFARVLRRQILAKDRRWIVARPRPAHDPSAATIATRIELGRGRMAFPVIHLATTGPGATSDMGTTSDMGPTSDMGMTNDSGTAP